MKNHIANAFLFLVKVVVGWLAKKDELKEIPPGVSTVFILFQGTKSIETIDVLHHSVRIQVPLDQNLLTFRSGLITSAKLAGFFGKACREDVDGW